MKKLKEINPIWWCFFLLVISYSIIGLVNYKGIWTNSFLQVGAILLTITFTLILTLDNNKQLGEQTREQIEFISKNTDRQIEELRKATDKEIQALQETTDKQIDNYRDETEKLIRQLKNNSELLAGILQRQLEDAIQETNNELSQAHKKYNNLQEFKLLRSEEEKKSQLYVQKSFIRKIELKLRHFKNQYEKLSDFIRGNI